MMKAKYDNEHRKNKYKSMEGLSPSEISGKLWLSGKDVAEITTLSLSTIMNFISKGDFPRPYKMRGSKRVWCPDDVNKWLASLSTEWHGKDNGFTPVTWDSIKAVFKKGDNMSNEDIASIINADVIDVQQLTKLMERAGELICMRRSVKSKKRYSLRG